MVNPSDDLASTALADVIRSRRTSMVCDREREVPAEVIDRLCELATWAPNHKRTWPWRFAAFSGDGRMRLGEACRLDLMEAGSTDEGKLAKVATKYGRTPSVLVIGCAPDDHPTFHDENRDAVAAGIQNLLLAATAEGLASYWSTAPVLEGRHTLELCGFEAGVRVIGIVYLGWVESAPAPVERPPVEVRHITR